MTREELIKLLSEPFCENFATETALLIRDAGATGLLYEVVASEDRDLPKPVRHKVLFRGAYVLERIYFGSRELFMPNAADFCQNAFPVCSDASARRHFGKIMADLLRYYTPELSSLDRIAEVAAEWAVDPQSRVSVRVWAVEVLKLCRTRVGWVAESWDDIMEAMAIDATPGIESRMRTSWKSNQ